MDKQFEELCELLAGAFPYLADQIRSIMWADRCEKCGEITSQLSIKRYCQRCTYEDHDEI